MRSNSKGVAALERALKILGVFREATEPLSLTELAAKTGFYKSTILRLTVSLERYGYLSRLLNGRFMVGPMLFQLGQVYQRSFRLAEFVRPILQDLADSQRESATYWIADGKHRLCLFRVESPQPIRDGMVREGDRLPSDNSATSTVLRAFAEPLDPSLEPMRRKLVHASLGGFIRDLAGIACPVFGQEGKVIGVITLAGPMNRFNDRSIARMREALLASAERLTLQIAGDPGIYERVSGRKPSKGRSAASKADQAAGSARRRVARRG
jgi:DNA-binding IclR family transcriptional regulator